ncbi:hypothetical protein HB364_13605 [Pseudoflavitalea sp. X16]|uniref:hypothetical protein n=1 Tax=Paraflavitalea devenefica TaxID=2716334 RepID=UPI00142463F3|nr:hypothetical protein [Paraflavitalea devenefica]NII26124.1 hypothetical protein [Paraflavitalea devenefica]
MPTQTIHRDKFKFAYAVILLALCLAVTAHVTGKKIGQHTYGVLSFDPYYFYIAEELDGEVMDMDYECNMNYYSICTISSDYLPDPLGRIPRAYAITLVSGTYFNDLNPFY